MFCHPKFLGLCHFRSLSHFGPPGPSLSSQVSRPGLLVCLWSGTHTGHSVRPSSRTPDLRGTPSSYRVRGTVCDGSGSFHRVRGVRVCTLGVPGVVLGWITSVSGPSDNPPARPTTSSSVPSQRSFLHPQSPTCHQRSVVDPGGYGVPPRGSFPPRYTSESDP